MHAIVDPHPLPFNPNPVYPDPIVIQQGVQGANQVAFELTVNNQCIDEGGGPRSSLAVTTRSFDTATGALLFTGVNMQPAGMLMDWRSWSRVPADDATAPDVTMVI